MPEPRQLPHLKVVKSLLNDQVPQDEPSQPLKTLISPAFFHDLILSVTTQSL